MRYLIHKGTMVTILTAGYNRQNMLTHRDVIYTNDDIISQEPEQVVFQFPRYTPKGWSYPVHRIGVSPKDVWILLDIKPTDTNASNIKFVIWSSL